MQDLIRRVTDRVFTSDAQAELTSLSAAKLGTPDYAQICQILVDMGLIPAQKAGMAHDALEDLYMCIEQNSEGGQGSRPRQKQDRRGERGGTRHETAMFYSRLSQAVEHRDRDRAVRRQELQGVVSASEGRVEAEIEEQDQGEKRGPAIGMFIWMRTHSHFCVPFVCLVLVCASDLVNVVIVIALCLHALTTFWASRGMQNIPHSHIYALLKAMSKHYS